VLMRSYLFVVHSVYHYLWQCFFYNNVCYCLCIHSSCIWRK